MEWTRPLFPAATINRAARVYDSLFEDAIPVPQWDEERWRLYRESVALIDHWRACHAYASAIQTVVQRVQDAHYFLLELDPTLANPVLNVTGFSREKTAEAQKAYAEAEIKVKEKPGTDAVLVSVDSISNLSHAYPNYYADTRVFLDLLGQALSGRQRRIRV